MNMNYFYNKEIEIYTYSSIKDEYGTNRKVYAPVKNYNATNIYSQLNNGTFTTLDTLNDTVFLVDVQPYNMNLAVRDYGYQVECTKRIFMDIIPEITESAVIRYKNQFYKIQKVIDWEDYLDVICLERDDVSKWIVS